MPARALLPLRLFFGVTFLYAGFDKLLDPAFFDASGPASIVGQLAAFARVSPLAPLVHLIQPFAIPMGLLIAIAEIAIGLGALTGLAYRLAAAGGAVLSLVFWLTASWTTHPYYYGADLPYAFGWVTLALAGHAGLLVPTAIRDLGNRVVDQGPWGPRGVPSSARLRDRPGLVEEPSASRRFVLQAAVLGAAALAVASLAAPVRFLRPSGTGNRTASAGGGTVTPTDSPAGTPSASGTPQPGGTAPATAGTGPAATPSVAQGVTVSTIANVDKQGAALIRIPADAPSPYPAGDPGIIVKLPDGTYVAYDATCTHRGCTVGWDAQDSVILCPCHGAAFDPANHAAVLGGPTNTPLLELPIVVDHQAGTISLRA
ncbi:MAG TPA: Rieske 2Fe-2S domain-containing protein [Candidatus Limnocylindrales bacterium]